MRRGLLVLCQMRWDTLARRRLMAWSIASWWCCVTSILLLRRTCRRHLRNRLTDSREHRWLGCMLTLVTVRILQLRSSRGLSRSGAELTRHRRTRLMVRHLLWGVVGMDDRSRTRWLLCWCHSSAHSGGGWRLLLLLRRNAASPTHVVDRHLVVGHRASRVQSDAEWRRAARWYLRLSSR